jgi:hypothetical protein
VKSLLSFPRDVENICKGPIGYLCVLALVNAYWCTTTKVDHTFVEADASPNEAYAMQWSEKDFGIPNRSLRVPDR